MLKRFVFIALLGFLLLPAAATPAQADEGCKEEYNNRTGSVVVVCSGGGGKGSKGSGNSDDSGAPSSGSGERVCQFEGNNVPCRDETLGDWADDQEGWCHPVPNQPSKDDPVWKGHTDGGIYSCIRPQNGSDQGVETIVWMPEGGVVPAPPPNPEDLAWRAAAGLNLAPINMGIAPTPLDQNPDSLGAVGLPVWLWVETPSSNTTGPTLTSSASERGYTVTIRAQMTGIDWDLGDGGQVITCGLGNRFDPKTMGPETPVSCGRQHGYQKQGEYTITATSHWKIEWGGIGRTGVITMDRSTSARVRIGELQTVVVPNKKK